MIQLNSPIRLSSIRPRWRGLFAAAFVLLVVAVVHLSVNSAPSSPLGRAVQRFDALLEPGSRVALVLLSGPHSGASVYYFIALTVVLNVLIYTACYFMVRYSVIHWLIPHLRRKPPRRPA